MEQIKKILYVLHTIRIISFFFKIRKKWKKASETQNQDFYFFLWILQQNILKNTFNETEWTTLLSTKN